MNNKVKFMGVYDLNQHMMKCAPGANTESASEGENRIKKFFLAERRMMRGLKKLQICPKDTCCMNNLQRYFSSKRSSKPKQLKSSLDANDYYKFLLKYSPHNLEDMNVGNMKISYKKYLLNPFAPNQRCSFKKPVRKKKKCKTICKEMRAKMKQRECNKNCKAKVPQPNTKPCFFSIQGLYENHVQYQQNVRCGDRCKAGPFPRKKPKQSCCGLPGLYPITKSGRLNICNLKPLIVKPKKHLTYHDNCFSPSTRIIKKISYTETDSPCTSKGIGPSQGHHKPTKLIKLPKGVIDMGRKKDKCCFLEVFNFYVNQRTNNNEYRTVKKPELKRTCCY